MTTISAIVAVAIATAMSRSARRGVAGLYDFRIVESFVLTGGLAGKKDSSDRLQQRHFSAASILFRLFAGLNSTRIRCR
jgi:hypothetical protein